MNSGFRGLMVLYFEFFTADAAYENGVTVFTMTKGGLVYEASIGGQKFKYFPEDQSE